MEDWREAQELLVMEGRIKVPYLWSAGEVGTRYLTALQEEGKFMGTRCPACDVVYHVPRMHCPDCFPPARNGWSWEPEGSLRPSRW